MAGKFELFKGKGWDFRFHLKAATGEIRQRPGLQENRTACAPTFDRPLCGRGRSRSRTNCPRWRAIAIGER
jgi:hypothetical protein